MSASVDVLAVLDAAEMTARVIGEDEAADDFEAARAAVAELIEAVEEIGCGRSIRVATALARVKGGAV